MQRLSSSLRRRSAAETLRIARTVAPDLGITRVTDTTWLDRIGIPVFASIRPAAQSGSLCVNAGKGLLTKVLVPAELVFIPLTENPGQRVFGESSNGLASGNDLLEASVHGLCELLERDVQAFGYVDEQSMLVDLDAVSPAVSSLVQKITGAGLALSVRYTSNAFGMAYFQAFLMENFPEAPVSIASGTGFHPIKEIALIRAVCEAAQSRLSHIHGGRDDIIRRVQYFERVGRDAEVSAIGRLRSLALGQQSTIAYNRIPDAADRIASLEEAWDLLVAAIRAIGIHTVLRVTFTKPEDPLQVVRILAPKLESFEPNLKRIGPRLMHHVKAHC